MKVLRIILLILLALIVIVAVGGFVIFNDTTRGPLPQHSGDLSLTGLNDRVEVLRDAYGVPHIYASNLHDLYFAQGFTQAQDRWWQMEFWRHTGSGTIQELTGKTDSLMGTDVFIQTIGWRRAAERDAQTLDPEMLVRLQAFADGVNAYILNRPADDLALEYRLLGVTGVSITIEPWTIVDSLVWGKVIAWNLTSTYGRELTRETILDEIGADMLADYAPPYPFERHPTILFEEDLPLSENSLAGLPAFERASTNTPSSRRVAGGLDAASMIVDPGIGSNNWVATDSMTATGAPLLANDPHLGIQMPSIWYELGLHCQPISAECPLDAAGFTFAPVGGIISGHNATVAWGITNVGADVQDLYQIRVNPENPLQYEWNGEWRDMTVIDTEIAFGDGAESIPMQIRETHLGPIINDNDIDPETGALTGFNNDDPLALRWTGLDTSSLWRAVYGLNTATNWDDFRAALADFNIPAQNFVYADINGNIGYQTPGSIPIRAANHTGLTPVPGWTDEYEWRGYVPFDNLPRIYNPARDFIATANQAVVPMSYYDQLADTLGEDANYQFSYDWSYGYRGARIVELLESLAPHTADTFAQIQGDNKSLVAQDMMPYLSALTFEDAGLTDARDWLASWNFMNDMDSAQAVLWAHFTRHILQDTFDDQLPEGITATHQQMWSLTPLLDDPENLWWDDAMTTDEIETRDAILMLSFETAWDAANAEQGSDRDAWRWGEVHTATFISNPLGLSGISVLEDMVNRGGYETGGGSEIVNATGWGGDTFEVEGLPSYRMIIDLANLDNSRSIHTTGQSGHPYSDHYSDMIDAWRNIEYKPMLFSRAAVEAAAQSTLILNP